MNEIFVAGLVKAMKEKVNSKGDVVVRYQGEMYMRGHIFRVEGTNIEGNMNEVLEAAAQAKVTLTHVGRKADAVIERAYKLEEKRLQNNRSRV